MNRGAEFGEVTPLRQDGTIGRAAVPPGSDGSLFNLLDNASYGSGASINNAAIQQVTPTNSFRIGQQVFFTLGVSPLPTRGQPTTYASTVRLKLWWLRPNVGYRAAGFPSWQPIDRSTFGDGPVAGNPLQNNRWVWVPSPKRLDITPYQSPPPAASPVLNSDSELLDECWKMDLFNPFDPVVVGNFPAPQFPVRWDSILMPAMGYALGWTWDATFVSEDEPQPFEPAYSLIWQTGTLGGTAYQESIG